MGQKKLKWMLEELKGFKNPKIELEQYSTSAELALAMMDTIDNLCEFDGACVADLGCGSGMLIATIAAAYEPSYVLGIDLDLDSLETCSENLLQAEVLEKCELLQMDVLRLGESISPIFDVVVINPPFGTKNNAGIDMKFVQAGIAVLKPGGSVFSLHKTSTREFILRSANKLENVENVECLAQLNWELPRTYKFHRKKTADIDVDLMRFQKNP